LTERGLKVLVLEAGRPIEPDRDYVEHVPIPEMIFRGMSNREETRKDQPIQRTGYACDEWASKFFVKDAEHPYTTDPDKPFAWICGRQVGGKSIMCARQLVGWYCLV